MLGPAARSGPCSNALPHTEALVAWVSWAAPWAAPSPESQAEAVPAALLLQPTPAQPCVLGGRPNAHPQGSLPPRARTGLGNGRGPGGGGGGLGPVPLGLRDAAGCTLCKGEPSALPRVRWAGAGAGRLAGGVRPPSSCPSIILARAAGATLLWVWNAGDCPLPALAPRLLPQGSCPAGPPCPAAPLSPGTPECPSGPRH